MDFILRKNYLFDTALMSANKDLSLVQFFIILLPFKTSRIPKANKNRDIEYIPDNISRHMKFCPSQFHNKMK